MKTQQSYVFELGDLELGGAGGGGGSVFVGDNDNNDHYTDL